MGRNKRHKKQVRSERAKVKLKDHKTKFLPKGQNVTDASFKIKPIILPEQLKTYDSGVILKKRLVPIKIILDRLNHHNKLNKEEACEQLRQVIDANEGVHVDYLPLLLKSLCPLLLHDEPTVRQKSLKTIESILLMAGKNTHNRGVAILSPFHPILISFLRSSLTHIKRPIREDSLHFLDVLLRHVPRMLAQHSGTLLPIYLSLMSKHRAGGTSGAPSASGPSPSKFGRSNDGMQNDQMLSVDLGSTMTSNKWRLKVLTRLYGILDAIGDVPDEDSDDNSSNVQAPIVDITENNTFPLIVDYFSDNSEKLYNYTGKNEGNNIDSLANNLKNILWILFDSWAEVAPDKNSYLNNSKDCILSVEAAAILSGILKIIFLLWDKVLRKSDISTLNVNITEKFLNDLLSLFPFHKRVGCVKGREGTVDDQRCSQENLILCYIFALMNPKLYKQDKIESGRKVANYLNSSLKNRSVMKHNNITYLTKCLSVIFNKNAAKWHKGNCVNMDELLGNTINFHISSPFNKELFYVLCDLTQEKSLRSLPAYEVFLSYIPSLLCKREVSVDTIHKIHWISTQRIKVFYTSLLECLPEILHIFSNMQIINSDQKLLNQKLKILYMFENCPDINNLHKEYFKAFVQEFNEENEYTYYVNNFILKEQA